MFVPQVFYYPVNKQNIFTGLCTRMYELLLTELFSHEGG